jgi:hypothetical protein
MIFFFFVVLGFELSQDLHLEPLHQPNFCDGFFRDRVSGAICPAGFELQSSWSLPPE